MNLFDNNPSCDYFIDTTDLLIPVFQFQVYQEGQAPGASNPTINAGTVRNEGIEFSHFSNKFSDDFNMTLGYHIVTKRSDTNGFF
jgi:hypothetical protein